MKKRRGGGEGREWKHGEESTSEQAREMNWPQGPNCKTQKAPAVSPNHPASPPRGGPLASIVSSLT